MISKALALKLAQQGRLRQNGGTIDFGRMKAWINLTLVGGTQTIVRIPQLGRSALDEQILAAVHSGPARATSGVKDRQPAD